MDKTVWKVIDGRIHKNGNFFLPLGFYYMARDAAGKDKRLKDFGVYAATGANVVVTQFNDESSDWAYFNLCRRAGIHILVEFSAGWDYPTDAAQEANIAALARRVKDSPEVMGFLIRDDVDDGTLSSTEAKRRSDVLKAAAPNKLTWLTGNTDSVWNSYIGCSDIYSKYNYPTKGEDNLGSIPYSLTYVSGSSTKILAQPATCFMGGPGCGTGQFRYSVNETKSSFWQFLGQGCKGNLCYSFRESSGGVESWNLADSHFDNIRAEYTNLFAEAKSLDRYFGSGTRTLVDHSEAQNTTCCFFTITGKPFLVFFANNYFSSWDFASFNVTLSAVGTPLAVVNNLTRLNSRYPVATISSGVLKTGVIPASDIGIWKLK